MLLLQEFMPFFQYPSIFLASGRYDIKDVIK